jgi:hypothetical protein
MPRFSADEAREAARSLSDGRYNANPEWVEMLEAYANLLESLAWHKSNSTGSFLGFCESIEKVAEKPTLINKNDLVVEPKMR